MDLGITLFSNQLEAQEALGIWHLLLWDHQISSSHYIIIGLFPSMHLKTAWKRRDESCESWGRQTQRNWWIFIMPHPVQRRVSWFLYTKCSEPRCEDGAAPGGSSLLLRLPVPLPHKNPVAVPNRLALEPSNQGCFALQDLLWDFCDSDDDVL